MALSWLAPADAAEPLNLRVVWTESPQTRAVVVWDSIGGGAGMLHLREDAKDATEVKLPAAFAEYPANGEDGTRVLITHCHSVVLTGLKPSTRYRLLARVDADSSREYYFRTAPAEDTPFKLFFVGDSRTQLDKTRAVSQTIRQMFEQDASYIGLLHGGDMADTPTTPNWDAWLAAYALTTTADGRLLPIIPVRGNHEGKGSGVFDLAYGSPGGEIKNYYTCMVGPQVAIIVLNSMVSADGDQRDFLEASLQRLQRQRTRFQMAAYHIPLYPAIKQPHRGRQAWVPLFEQYHLDLGLESDGHCIKRTVPIRDEQPAEGGVVYLGEGGYGAPQRTYQKDRWYLEQPAFVGKGEHVMVLAFDKEQITYFTEQLGAGRVDAATFPAKAR